VRSGSTLTLYIDGVANGTSTQSATVTGTANTWWIGAAGDDLTLSYLNGYVSNFRVVKGTAVYTSNFTPPTSPLTDISGTSLLTLQNNQPVNNNVFLDNSTNNSTITKANNVTQGTFSPYGGNWSNYFDGSGDYLNTPSNAALSVGTGAFTLECFVYFNSVAAGLKGIVGQLIETDNTYGVNIYQNGTSVVFNLQNSTTSSVNFTSTVATGQWYHLVFVKNASNNISAFVNGSRLGTNTNTQNAAASSFVIGRVYTNLNDYYGNNYISNVRLVKGTAVYDPTASTLVVPTVPLTAITNTSLLTCADNRLIDDSVNNFAITRNGDVSVQRFSPFSPLSSLPVSYGAYFDGTGDRLDVPNNTALQLTGVNFTLEAWVYYTTATAYVHFFSKWNTSSFEYQIYIETATGIVTINVSPNGTGPSAVGANSASNAITPNTWRHIAWVRSGSTDTLYINGVSAITTTSLGSIFTGTSSLSFFGRQDGSFYGTGYLSNARVVKGTAVYTANFTPPTLPLTAIANTSLLTCQSPSLIDNSTNNFTITRNGDVRPVTQNPFGFTNALTTGYDVTTVSGSAYFDGSGDFLLIPYTPISQFGSTNFTIEFWVNFSSVASGQQIISAYGATNLNYAIYTATNGTLNYYLSSNGTTWNIASGVSMGSVSVNTWIHVALVRNGSTFIPYLNGVAGTTATSASSIFTNTQPICVGAHNTTTVSSFFNGYISDLRIIKGTALYTGPFVPPVAPLTAVQNTVLLNNFTNAAIADYSTMNNLETVGGASLTTATSKYGGSSLFFDGTGDGLYSRPNPNLDFGTGNFTIEWWMYFSSKSGYQTIVSYGYTPETATGWLIQTGNGDGKIVFYKQTGGVTVAADAGATVNTGQWYHIAVVRNSGTTTIYRDGTSVGSGADSNNYVAPTGNFYLGGGSNTAFNNFYFNGYIDDLRITRGVARYTANFTPPVSAFQIK
jgi:hypothetical protein